MQQIDLYCKNCNKSFKIAHVISGDDSTPVLQNKVIKCHHCREKRVLILKKWTEGDLIKRADNEHRCYV